MISYAVVSGGGDIDRPAWIELDHAGRPLAFASEAMTIMDQPPCEEDEGHLAWRRSEMATTRST